MIQTRSLSPPYRTAVTNGGFELTADAPLAKGGGATGFGPHELLEAALAACINMAVRMHAAAHSMPLQGVAARVRLDRSAADAAIFEYQLELDGPLSADQRLRLEQAARDCPVRRTLSGRLEFRAVDSSG